MISFKHQPLYPREKLPRRSMYKKRRGFEFGSGCFGERKNLVSLPGIGQQFLGWPTRSLMTVLTELSWLQQVVSYKIYIYIYLFIYLFIVSIVQESCKNLFGDNIHWYRTLHIKALFAGFFGTCTIWQVCVSVWSIKVTQEKMKIEGRVFTERS